MLITDRPYVSHILTPFEGTIEQFTKPVNQEGLKGSEKNVIRIQTLGLPKSTADYTKELADKLKELMGDNAVNSHVYLGCIPIDYAGNHVEKSKKMWQQSQSLIMQASNMKQLLDTGLFAMCADQSLRVSVLKELSVALTTAQSSYNMSDSQLQTLFFKLAYWLDNELNRFYDTQETNINFHFPRKAIFIGGPKKHELIYLELLNRLGIDIWIGNTAKTKDQVNEDGSWYVEDYAEQGVIDHALLQNALSVQLVTHQLQQEPIPINRKNVRTQNIEMTYEELANLGQAVVLIQVYGPGDEIIGRGSGVVINDAGLIATNVHVVMKGLKYGVQFENNQEEIITEQIYFLDILNDLAILNLKRKTPYISLKQSDDLRRGQEIVTIGSPLGLMNTISNGIVSGFRSLDGVRFIQITAPISHGSSGGALLDKYGVLVGITSAGFSEGQNLNLAIPVTEVNRLLKLKWLEISEALFGLSSQLKINGIQFIPRLSQDDNKDIVVLLYPTHKDFHAYYRTCVNRGEKCFDKQVKPLLSSVLSKYRINTFDYYFLPVGESDE